MPGYSWLHFRGKTGKSSFKKNKSTRKQRKLKRGTHRNKFIGGEQ